MIKSNLTEEDINIIKFLFGKNSFQNKLNTTEFRYISNSDNSVRWLFPSDLKFPFFLNFYSTSSARAKLLSLLIKVCFFLRLKFLITSRKISFHIGKNSILGNIIDKYNNVGYSIFTGTVGENRKAVIELHNKNTTFLFLKVALTESSKELIQNEINSLNFLNSIDINQMIVPSILNQNVNGIVEINNIKPKIIYDNISLSKIHLTAIFELYNKTYKRKKWNNISVLKSSKLRFLSLKNQILDNGLCKNEVDEFFSKINYLSEYLEKSKDYVSVSLSHGDFTPWNMYLAKEKIHVYDWELSQKEMPMMYDIFHFIFQTNILLKRKGYSEIKNDIKLVLSDKKIKDLVKRFDINLDFNYSFYLVYVISYYMSKYTKQKKLHVQVFWMIKVWREALQDVIHNRFKVFYEK